MEFLIVVCSWHLPHHWKRHQSWMGFAFVVLDKVAFLDRQFLIAWLFHQLAHVLCDLFFDNHFHLCGASASYLPIVHVISMLEVVDLALLMNIS